MIKFPAVARSSAPPTPIIDTLEGAGIPRPHGGRVALAIGAVTGSDQLDVVAQHAVKLAIYAHALGVPSDQLDALVTVALAMRRRMR